jgi:anti-sigma factor RsiW
MNEDIHKKAASLAATSRIEGISETDRAWLDDHLANCAACAEYAASVERAVMALRLSPVAPDPAVMESTRRRVRVRAMELREQRARLRGLWIACVFSWLLGACCAPLLWMAFRWMGQHLDLPRPMLIVALGAYWIIPAALGAAVLAKSWSRKSEAEDSANDAPQ